jgi:hypothetical protein
MTEEHIYGRLIAKLMSDKITQEESAQLEKWICENDQNMRLFEDLINDWKWKWAKQWFKNHGIDTRSIKWKDPDGWYKPDKKNLRDFYIVMAVMFLFLVLVYFVLEM